MATASSTPAHERIPISFDPWYRALSSALLLRPADAFLDLGPKDVAVRMGWAFQAQFARSAVRSATILATRPLSRGVHGFGGRWLVNGSADGVVVLDLYPAQTARVLGFQAQLRQLLVSVDDPPHVLRCLALAAPTESR